MKKIFSLILCVMTISLIVSACNKSPSDNIVKPHRRFAQYIEQDERQTEGIIDLSDGKKQKYDAYFGPKALNFDFSIKDPY